MPQYMYTAVDISGKQVSGSMEATSIDQLTQRIKDKNLFLTSAEDQAEARFRSEVQDNRKVPIKSLAIFCRQFATLINSGITAVKSLDILYQQTEDKILKRSIGQIYESVQKGEAMSEAFKKQGLTYPELFTNMVLAGESSGNLDAVLLRMAEHYEKENKLNNKIKGAMIYPIVLSVVAVAVVILMLVAILPAFLELILSAGGEIPGPTRFIMGISKFLTGYWWLVLGIATILIIGWRAFIRSDKGRLWWDTKKVDMPIVGKSLKMIYTSRFARTLSTLLSSGIQMLPAIDVTSRVIGNRLIHDRLIESIEDIRKGVSLSLSLKRIDQFPPMIHNMVSVGEESGLLDDVLTKTANFYDEESEAAIQRLVGLLEPLLIVVMGLVIGFIVVAMYMPMLGMFQAFS